MFVALQDPGRRSLAARFTWTSLIAVLALLMGCSSDNGPTEPPDPPEESIGSATIGAEGGVLETSLLTIEVPPGAFRTATEIEVMTRSGDVPFSDGAAACRIQGLPTVFDQPLTLRLPCATPAGPPAEAFVAIGENVFVRSLGETEIAWGLEEATYEEGFLSVVLPAPETDTRGVGRSAADYEIMNLPVGGTFTYSSIDSRAGHFRIYYPIGGNNRSEAEILGGYLEEAHADIQELGFSYGGRTRWPVRVIIRSLGAERFGESISSAWGDDYGYLQFNLDRITEHAEMRVTAGHEFFHLIQALYDPRSRVSKAYTAAPHLWLDEATAVWAEALFSDDPQYRSTARAGQLCEPLEGMQAGAADDPGGHGYGMAAMIRYLVGLKGPSLPLALHERILAGDHPVAAVTASVDDPAVLWWSRFLRAYLLGEIYGDEPEFVISQHSGRFVATAGDTTRVLAGTYPDLSAKVYQVLLAHENLAETGSVVFRVSGEGSPYLAVFQQQDGGLSWLGGGAEEFTVENAGKLQRDGARLIALVSNSAASGPDYASNSAIELEVTVVSGLGILGILQRTERLLYWARIGGGTHTFRLESPDTSYTFTEYGFPGMGGDMIPGDIYDGPAPPLTWVGRSFSAAMGYREWSWTLSGSLSRDGTKVVSVAATGTYAAEGDEIAFSFDLSDLALAEAWRADSTSCAIPFYAPPEGPLGHLGAISYVRTLTHPTEGATTVTYEGTDWYAPLFFFSFQQRRP